MCITRIRYGTQPTVVHASAMKLTVYTCTSYIVCVALYIVALVLIASLSLHIPYMQRTLEKLYIYMYTQDICMRYGICNIHI